MQAGSPFQCGRRVRGYVLGWTQTEVFGFFPLNNALVYGRERLGTNCGAASPHAVAVVTDNEAESAYWMGLNNFFSFAGSVQEMECELRDYVFNDINQQQRVKFQARANSKFSEVWFFYCSALSAEIDRAVVYDYARQTWTKANVARTCWLDRGIFALPIAIAADGTVYQHEIGATANGAAMASFVVSHPITVGEGQQFADIDGFWPDMQEGSSACTVSFLTRDSAGGAQTIYGPYNFAIGDEKVDLAISCRQFQVKIAGVAGHWEVGRPLISRQGGSLR